MSESNVKYTEDEALEFHSRGRAGKIEVIATKPMATQRDLALAYSPGVAVPVRAIADDPGCAYDYTAKGNLVAVISNGTAILGLGNLGALAAKPVMEGKAVLFKRFADVDAIDIEVKTEDPQRFIDAVELLDPSFGGINLEDIAAPDCFVIEQTLKERMNIPVFHDDQHGTAIITAAGLINACHLTGRKLADIRVVVNGAGAAAIACTELIKAMGVRHDHVLMCDRKGVISKDRNDLDQWKSAHAVDTDKRSLAEAIEGADVFLGLSAANVLTPEMVKMMAKEPIIFAMANPDPEIWPPLAMEARPDAIIATGRSDFPNQVNNVLGFPFIFRGALDVRATSINDEMKMAATLALAKLAKEKVPEMVMKAYGGEEFEFGREYIIPKPFDPRVLWYVAPAVAKAAIETGVAKIKEMDWVAYEEKLKERLGLSKEIIRVMIHKAMKHPKKVVYPEGEEENIIRAAHAVYSDGVATPILLGNEKTIKSEIERIGFDVNEFQIVDPENSDKLANYTEAFFKKRQRKGATIWDAKKLMHSPNYFGSMMVELGEADALISGYTTSYPNTIKPALQCIGVKEGFKIVSGMYIVIAKKETYFFADCTVNVNPTAEQLAEIAISAAETVKAFDVVPKIAMLSFSNFGSAEYPESLKVKNAVQLVKSKKPELIIDGEMQADTAVVPEILDKTFPFTQIKGGANVLVFPDLNSANIAYKLMARIGQATVIGPILMGMRKPVHVLQRDATVDDIYNMTAIAVVEVNKNKSK